MDQIKQIKLIKESHKQNLMSKANVIGVAVGYKYINGIKTGDLSVIVDVSQKKPLAELLPEDIVPSMLDSIPTDVVELGNLVTHVDPKLKYRPASGGVSIGHFNVTAGTLGITLQEETIFKLGDKESLIDVNDVVIGQPKSETIKYDKYILSNNHVLANSNHAQIGDNIYQPAPYDGGVVDDTIATLHSFAPLDFVGTNLVDAALAIPINDSDLVANQVLEIGEVSGTVEAYLDMPVRKYGRTTQLTNGVVTQIHATVIVGGYIDGEAIFDDQIITTNMSEGGDSGSLLVEQNGYRAVGLLFAGSSTVTVHNRIQNVEDALDIDFTNNVVDLKGCRLIDGQDKSKEIRIDVSNMSPNTVRTLSSPDKDGTIALLSDISSGGNDGFVDRGFTDTYDFEETTLPLDSQWHKINLRPVVPINAKRVKLRVVVKSNTPGNCVYFRKPGNGQNSSPVYVVEPDKYNSDIIEEPIDENGDIEFWATNTAWTRILIVIKGWWI